jgi:polyhydroxyalkanoate synthase
MMVFPTGHIGIFVGSKSQKEVCPSISKWLTPRSGLDEKGTPETETKNHKRRSKEALHEGKR